MRSLARLAAVAAAAAMPLQAVTIEQHAVRNGAVEVPVAVARPAGAGPFPPVLYVHARRGFEDEDRRNLAALAAAGFLVAAPDWQSGRFIERWPAAHDPATEGDVEAAFDHLRARPDACRVPAAIVGYSRGPYYALRLAAKRPRDVAAIVSWYGHMQDPNAPEPDQVFRVAAEVATITAPMLMLIGEQDYEVRRLSAGRAFYSLYERGVPVELQVYPLARRAFDFRADRSPEERIAARHAHERELAWLTRWMRLTPERRCPAR